MLATFERVDLIVMISFQFSHPVYSPQSTQLFFRIIATFFYVFPWLLSTNSIFLCFLLDTNETEVSVLGAFKLDHFQPVKLILFRNFSSFQNFILGPFSYYPREGKEAARDWKWEKDIHLKMNVTQGFLYLGHSNKTIFSLLS